TVEPADGEEGNALGKDVYLSMFDQEIALQMARNSSLGIGEMMYRQLEQTIKEPKTGSGLPSESVVPAASKAPRENERAVQLQPSAPAHSHEVRTETDTEASTAW